MLNEICEGVCGHKLCGYRLLVVDWQAHRNAIFDIDWTPRENQLVTASGDQNIALWDVTAESSIATFHGHTSSIKTVRFMHSHDGQCHVFFIRKVALTKIN